ncbi:MAG: hypothetical protein IJQ48_05145 [Prevotella sp.]|nr:hypothetical protein [Prevotella sp.]
MKTINDIKKIILSIIFTVAALTATAQDKLIHVADKSMSWRKNKPQTTLFDRELARLLMPQGATFGVVCVPSFSSEWTLTYDSVARALVYKEAQTSIWHSTYQATHKKKKMGEKRSKWVPRKRPKDYVAPDVKTFTLPVSDDQAAVLRAVWKTAVYGAEVREVFILDGVKWEYFIDGRRAKSHRDKNILVVFTEDMRKAVRNGDTNRKDSLISNEFQRVIDGLTLAPPPEVLPPGTVRTLIIWNGSVLNDSLAEFHTIGHDDQIYFYQHHQMVKSIKFHYDEEEKREFAERYGITAKDLVMEFETVPDTLCDAYVHQHPELIQTRRYVEGYVLDEDGKPLADAWISFYDKSRMCTGAITDSIGHFVMWPPRTITKLYVQHVGYQTINRSIQPADTILNFLMKDVTKN